MEESTITINIRTGSSPKKLSFALSSAYNIRLEPEPGPTMTTLLLNFDDGSIALAWDSIDFQILPVVKTEAAFLPAISLTSSIQPSSSLSPLKSSPNRLSLGSGHSSVASIGSRNIDRNRSFDVSVKIRNKKNIVVNVSPWDTVSVLRTKIKAVNLTCPPVLAYNDAPLGPNEASLGFHKMCPGAVIIARQS